MRMVVLGAAAALAAACSGPSGDQAEGAGGGEADATAQAASSGPAPGEFAETAWRITAEDGARYTTYLDRDGSYRDLRNGDPWQTGQWTFNATGDGRLCLTPEDENGVERCWHPQGMREETMDATSTEGRRIELQRVDYRLPQDEDPAEG